MKLERAVWSALSLLLIPACGNSPQSTGSTEEALQSTTETASCESACFDWPQWGRSPDHEGNTCVRGQHTANILDDLVFDPFVAEEQADAGGDLLTHFQTPLIDGDDVYIETKSGTYTPCNPPGSGTPAGCGAPFTWATEIYNEARYEISERGKLSQRWSFASDWKPEPFFGWEPVFHGALSGDSVYVPGAGGTLFKLDKASGRVRARINPFGTSVDPSIYVAGPISVDNNGNLYYNALKLAATNPQFNPAQGWLVKIGRHGQSKMVDYATLVPDGPKATDQCNAGYDPSVYSPPFPPLNPDGTVVPPQRVPCGPQRPNLNIAPAIAPDGTIYVVSRAHIDPLYTYLVAVNPDLTPKWDRSLRNLVHDGCGVLVPEDGNVNPFDCTPGAPIGIDPNTGEAPALAAIDLSSSSPVVLPDGNVIYGAFTGYNNERGHLVKFSRHGELMGTFDFGWDVTPAVYRHDGTYSILTKDNHYTFNAAGQGTGPYYLTRLSPDLKPEWQFLSTNTETCIRDASGNVSCTSDHPFGFEWCINAPAVDRDGNMYANSEDGNLYVIDRNGNEKDHLFLNFSLGAAYTPVSLDKHGHILALNGGHLSVVGQ
jgi:outer membrane protein assembly factor BamB